MVVSYQTREQVEDTLRRISQAWITNDTDTLSPLIFTEAEVVSPAGRVRGREAILQSRDIRPAGFQIGRIQREGVVAWVAGTVTNENIPRNFTAVMRGTGHAWELALLHIS